MSALGQKQTCAAQKVMSALPLKADMCGATRDVRFVPKADVYSEYAWARPHGEAAGRSGRLHHFEKGLCTCLLGHAQSEVAASLAGQFQRLEEGRANDQY